MLKIEYIDTRGNILREDLTGIKSDAKKLKGVHQEMARLCQEHQGIGLAASQVGLRENFFFITAAAKFPAKRGKPVAHMCINPSWTPADTSKKQIGVEGCLSLPGREFNVPRETIINAEWDNAVGHRVKMKLKGLAAVVFQHEYDHLKGVTLLETGEEIK